MPVTELGRWQLMTTIGMRDGRWFQALGHSKLLGCDVAARVCAPNGLCRQWHVFFSRPGHRAFASTHTDHRLNPKDGSALSPRTAKTWARRWVSEQLAEFEAVARMAAQEGDLCGHQLSERERGIACELVSQGLLGSRRRHGCCRNHFYPLT